MAQIGDFILIMNKNRRGRARNWIGTHKITASIQALRAHTSYNDQEDFISKTGINLVEIEDKSLNYVPTGRKHGGKIHRIEAAQ